MYCNNIEIKFTFNHIETGEEHKVFEEFEPTCVLESDIDNFADGWIEENEGYELLSAEVDAFDTDFADPDDFTCLDEYGDYIEKCVKHGEGFKLRFEDVGDADMDEYCGCWDSEKDFIRNLVEDTMDIPDHLYGYLDWDKLTRDYMMDFSSYDGEDGTHIFRD